MYILCYNLLLKDIEKAIEALEINDIFDFFYESPLEITTDDNGYGYIEKEEDNTILKITFNGEENELKDFTQKIDNILNLKCSNIYEEKLDDYSTFVMEPIHINDSWVLADPSFNAEGKNKINFISQGAFGTGLHNTTQDLLRIILSMDFKNKTVLDIGTGSGILSIATAIKNAEKVVALDIRDVTDEVMLNASLNDLNNIEVLIGDAISNEVKIDEKFDWIYINIGGDETIMFMDFIKAHLKPNGKILVSGLVEWSFDKIKTFIEKNDFFLEEKYQNEEWCTAIFKLKLKL